MLRNVFVIEISDTHIQQDIEQKGKVIQSKIDTIGTRLQGVLHNPVNTKYPNRFNNKVKQHEPAEAGKELFLHGSGFDQHSFCLHQGDIGKIFFAYTARQKDELFIVHVSSLEITQPILIT